MELKEKEEGAGKRRATDHSKRKKGMVASRIAVS